MSTTTAAGLAGNYVADEVHSTFGFAVRYMGVSKYRGTFGDVSATVTADESGTRIEGTAKAESISITNPPEFRAHVLADDFFAVDKYPTLAFRSDSVELGTDGTATVVGELTIKGITKPVTAKGTWQGDTPDAFGGTKASIVVETEVNRRDFGITWDAPLPGGGSALADEVAISVELVLVKQA